MLFYRLNFWLTLCSMHQDEHLRQQIGEKLKATRLQRNLTQAEVAERVGIDVTHISRLERGLSNPSLLTAYRICNVLNISLDFLFASQSTRSNKRKSG